MLGSIATIALGISGKLGWYVHPRYFAFTMAMSALVLILALIALICAARSRHGISAPDTHEPPVSRLVAAISFTTLAVVFVALFLVPPATLSSAATEGHDVALDAGAQSARSEGSQDTLLGYVVADTDDPENIFFVTRLRISCCAVDATPVGSPVYFPGWQREFEAEQWVEVQGLFGANPSATNRLEQVIIPESVSAVEEPKDPYVY
nr:DUF1980 domain-containing protein [Leucobacter chinensis]